MSTIDSIRNLTKRRPPPNFSICIYGLLTVIRQQTFAFDLFRGDGLLKADNV